MDCAANNRQTWDPSCGFISRETFGKATGFTPMGTDGNDGYKFSYDTEPENLGGLGIGNMFEGLPTFGNGGAQEYEEVELGGGASCMQACQQAYPGRKIYMAIPVGFTCVCSMDKEGADATISSKDVLPGVTRPSVFTFGRCEDWCSGLGYLHSAFCDDECLCTNDPDKARDFKQGKDCQTEETPKEEVVNSQQTCTNDCIKKGKKGGLWEGGECTCTDFATLKDKYRRCSCTKTGRNDCPSSQRDGDTWYYWRNVADCSKFGAGWSNAGFTAGRYEGTHVCDDDPHNDGKKFNNKIYEGICESRGFATGSQSGIYCQCT